MKVPPYLLALFVLMGLFASAKKAQAQTYQPSNRVPIADSTLGTTVIRNADNFAITGGLSRGQNTFHSFQDFSVPTNGAATFANPVGNQSIITRVTGNLFSDINGTINTQGANFLLINPNGVVFGPGTQLNVGRVFAASTANGVDLVDGAGRTLSFGTNTSGDGALLSIDPKVVFNVSRFNMDGGNSEIKNFGTLRTNNLNQYIGLLGGNVLLDGGKIEAPGGRVELGGLSAVGSVLVGVEGDSPRLSFLENVDRANISLSNQARVSVAGAGGGDISLQAHNIELLKDSVIRGGIEQSLGTPTAVAGDIKLNSTGGIRIDSGSVLANNVRTNSKGQGGNIIINADELALDGKIQSFTLGQGNSGNIRILVAKATSLKDKSSSILALGNEVSVGNTGNITIETGDLLLQNGTISNIMGGQGTTGNISIKAKNNVSLTSSSINNLTDSTKNGGNVTIETGVLSLREGSFISVSTLGTGNGGDVIVTAKDSISITGKDTFISTTVLPNSMGNGGDINLSTASLILSDGAGLISGTEGKGNAGKIFVTAKDAAVFSGTGTAINTSADINSMGNGGDISIKAVSLSITDGAQFSSSNAGKGNAGNVNLEIAKITDIAGQLGGIPSVISSPIAKEGEGNGGNITIYTGSLFLRNGAQLQTGVSGKGRAGNVNIEAKDTISFSGDKAFVSSTVGLGATGISGDINVTTNSLDLINGSFLATLNGGIGDAGSVSVKASGAVNITGDKINLGSGISSVITRNGTGNSGDINLQANSLSLQDNATLITSNFGQGKSGSIKISTSESVLASDRGGIIVLSNSNNGSGGNIDITSPTIDLRNGVLVTASSASGNGGNINIGSPETNSLILRNKARIFTDADGNRQQGGDGGNININSKFVIAIPGENSDITANAVGGRGGNVNILSQGVFGTQLRSQLTDKSDITASSRFGQNGSININTPGIDPGKDASELPTTPIDINKQISQTCSTSQIGDKFTIVGRGGHPPNTDDLPGNDVVWLDSRNSRPQVVANHLKMQISTKVPQPAIGWAFDRQGKVKLLAANTDSAVTRIICPTHKT
jgi:filamentous hemagglutinin family protein